MGTAPSGPESAAVTVRPAGVNDAEALAKLAGQLGYPSSPRQIEERLASVVGDPQHLVIAAVAESRVVGWAHAYLCCLVESDRFVELGGLVVDESFRGRGAGGTLLETVEVWARGKGCLTVLVRSNVIRDAAHRFYEAKGYQKVKTQHAFRKLL